MVIFVDQTIERSPVKQYFLGWSRFGLILDDEVMAVFAVVG